MIKNIRGRMLEERRRSEIKKKSQNDNMRKTPCVIIFVVSTR